MWIYTMENSVHDHLNVCKNHTKFKFNQVTILSTKKTHVSVWTMCVHDFWKGHHHHHYHHHQQSLTRMGCWGTTDDFTTSFLHFSLFLTTLWDLANSTPVHSLTLSSHLFFCLLLHFTVPCNMVLSRPNEQEICPYHCSLCLCTMVRRMFCGSIACWVTWSLYEMRSMFR